MSKQARPSRGWWRIWLATAAVVPLVAGGAAVASFATEAADDASPDLVASAPTETPEAAVAELVEPPIVEADPPSVPQIAPSPTSTNDPQQDTTPPVVTVEPTTAPASSGWYTGTSVTVRVTAEDDESGADVIEYRRMSNGAPWTDWSVVGRDGSGAIQYYLFEGVHEMEFRATDLAGNPSDVVPFTVRFDKSVEQATVADFPGTFVLGERYALEYACADAISGVASCESSNGPSGSTLPTAEEGEFEFTITSRDVAGNERTDTWRYIVATDTVPPTAAIESSAPANAAGWTSADSVIIRFTASDRNGIDRLWVEGSGVDPLFGQFIDGDEFEFTTAVDGLTTFTAYAIDEFGNESERVTLELRLDRLAPWVDVTSPEVDAPSLLVALQEVEQDSAVALEFACDDALSGIASCDGPDSLPTAVLGDQSVEIVAVDAAGNRTTETLEYTVVAPPATEQPGPAGAQGDPSRLARTGSEPTIWPAIAFVAILLALGAWMLTSARREGTHR